MTSAAVIDYITDTTITVEATRNEQLYLWQEHHKDNGIPWTDSRSGYLARVGELDGRPVMISVMRAVVNGQSVLFWHPTSVVVDYDMIADWLRARLPDAEHTDATQWRPV